MSSTPTKPDADPGSGRLWVVATPIGNLEDVTLRALRVLREADLVLAEDTRRTRALLGHHGIAARLRSFHAHTPPGQVEALVRELSEGRRIVLVTDAGTPVVSDPGMRLVRAAVEAGVRVETVPGPSAVTAALAVAAVPCDTFRFVGFLPRGGARRRRVLAEIAAERGASVLFEAPTRVAATLRELAAHTGSRTVAVCRELTKVHEEVVRGTAAELAERFADGTRGEVTVVVGGRGAEAGTAPIEPPDEEALARAVAELLAEGLAPTEAARRLAERTGIPRREAYRRVLRHRDGVH